MCRMTTDYLPNSAADGHLDCFQVIAIKDKDAMNIYMKAFCRHIYIYIYIYIYYLLESLIQR